MRIDDREIRLENRFAASAIMGSSALPGDTGIRPGIYACTARRLPILCSIEQSGPRSTVCP